MCKKIHLIMPMGGAGSRFFKDGFVMPKPLIKLKGTPFFYWAVQSITKFIEVKDITFVVLKEHIDEFHIDKVIYHYYPKAEIVIIPEVLDGAVLTCLNGVKNIQDDCPILFNDCDHMFICDIFNQFCNKGDFSVIDGALLTFESDEPKYSFLEYDEIGNVINTVEKVAVSNHAICGAYYFKNKALFEQTAKKYLNECSYNEFFVSGVYNIMAREKKCIKGFSTDIHIPFGVPEEYFLAEKDERLDMVK